MIILIHLIILKWLLSIIIVITLAEISKRVNPKLAGVFAGLPLGTGLSIYFISLEQGVDFAMNGIPWGISGLSGSLMFSLIYLFTARSRFAKGRKISIMLSSAAGISAFLMVGYLLCQLRLGLWLASMIFFMIFLGNLWWVNRAIAKAASGTSSRSTIPQMILRGTVVGGILLLITTISPLVGSKWASILSSFPSTLFPLLLILHYEEGSRLFPHVIYGFSYSITTLYLFYLAYMVFVPVLGLNMGYLAVYSLCGGYLILFQRVMGSVGMKQNQRHMLKEGR